MISAGALRNTIALVFRHLVDLSERDIELIKSFGTTNGIDIYLQPGGIDSVKKYQTIAESSVCIILCRLIR